MKHGDTTVHLSAWLKSKKPITPNVSEDEEQQELLLLADRNAKWHGHCGRHIGSLL